MQGRRPPKDGPSPPPTTSPDAWQKAILLIKATPTTLSVELSAQNTPNQTVDAIENGF